MIICNYIFMDNKNKQKLLEYIKSQSLMFLAGSSMEPWIATLYYAVDDNFDFYFVSEPSAIHSKAILHDGRVSCGIADSRQKVGEQKVGVQLSGSASLVTDENEARYAVALWNNANPGLEDVIRFDNLGKIDAVVYVVRPHLIKFFNEKLYGQEGTEILKLNVGAMGEPVFRGLIDAESVSSQSLKDFVSVGCFKEKNPDGDPPFFYVHKIIAKGKTVDDATHSLRKHLKRGWYAVFWDYNLAYFMFRNKIIQLPYHWTTDDFSKVEKFALSVGLEARHFAHIKKSMDAWAE